MIRKILRKILYSQTVIQFFNNDNFLSNFLLKKTNVFQRKFIKHHNYSHKNINSSKIFSFKDLQVPGEKFVYGGQIDKSINLKSMNSVAGFVPFQKNSTQILIYNFFSKNYSIRKQLLGTVYFLKGGKKEYQNWFLLPVDCVKFLDFKDLDLDADNLIVELFHQRLPANHGLHYGHLRFHGIYDNYSTVHSSPVENFYFKKNNGLSSRRYFPKWIESHQNDYNIKLSNLFEKSKILSVKKDKLYGDYSKKTLNPLGYKASTRKGING